MNQTTIMNNINMKSFKNFGASIFFGCVAIGTVGLLAPSMTLAEGKGASQLMKVAPVSSQAQTAQAKLSQMSCTGCTDGYVKVRDTAAKGMRAETTKPVAVHGCGSCETKIASVGTGKAKTDKVAHSCGNVGVASASCCMAAK
jgi:hypothetical protein